ncbi:kinase-like domain-containing protein [Thamnocephalis sphaerospora]|uniref:Kinase-like domain-containing protein n=1 Tax=Thamnocephalis sphaerospora TaxID=78915 RepID=A0A4P9XI89_9FUNG|nr:kinase-like domain-containing protein [Thamnocephalis sphaerospora]|eukprot:RKP05393.1 kinase-like domain-containing protein [Thamnocephalis sphaerospora]
MDEYDGSGQLEIGVELKLDLRPEDLQVIEELGAGNGGTVSKVMHMPTRVIMAKKNIHVEMQPQVKKQVLRELEILHHCDSPYIVSFFGAFLSEPDVCMCMEHMDVGSLDAIYRKHGPIPVPILGKITVAVLGGLVYLYENHRIIHRDVKPSNILVNSSGAIKICDFGVSGVLINSIANTFVGTSNYMSPERIKGDAYTVKSDVWSLGISLEELALAKFPFPSSLAIFELLHYIVNEPVPLLPTDKFPEDLVDFIKHCLIKDPNKRMTPKQLTVSGMNAAVSHHSCFCLLYVASL